MRPMVFGYIRAEPSQPAECIDHLRDELAGYAEREGLALIEIFVEPSVSEPRPERPAFRQLLDALCRSEAYGVLVPSLTHFSRFPNAQFVMCSLIHHETGARVIALDTSLEPG